VQFFSHFASLSGIGTWNVLVMHLSVEGWERVLSAGSHIWVGAVEDLLARRGYRPDSS
jgi:hypothetical protein